MRDTIPTALPAAVVIAGAALLAGLAGEKKDMEMKDAAAASGAAIPPIDAAAPLKTETATFALG